MKKILIILVGILSLPIFAHAQVFGQRQVIITPFVGVIFSTSTANSAPLSASSTPYFNNVFVNFLTSFGSTTLQSFTAQFSTTTAATTTNFSTRNLYANGSSTLQAFTGTNFLALGSTTLQSFTASFSTTTAATTTNINYAAHYQASASSTFQDIFVKSCTGCGSGSTFAYPFTTLGTGEQATGTALFFGAGLVDNASTTFRASTTLATTLMTNATATNFYVGFNFVAVNASTTNSDTVYASTTQFRALSATSTNLTTTNLLVLGSTTLQNFIGTSGTTSNFTSTNILATGSSTFQGLWAQSATSTNDYSTHYLSTGSSTFQGLFSTSATGTNLYAGNLLVTASSTFQALGATSATGTNLYAGNFLASASSTLQNATASAFAISTITSGNCLHTSTGGAIVGTGSDCGSGGSTFAFPFTKQNNGAQGTTSSMLFSGGFVSTGASTTIGNNTVATGLTIFGGATTTSDLLALGSTTLQSFTGTFSTTTAATTTNINYAGHFQASGSSTFQQIFSPSGTITSSTSTNDYPTNLLVSGSTTLQAFIGTSGTTTNDYSTHYLASGSSTFQALFSPSATGTNLYSTNFLALGSTTLQNFTGQAATTTFDSFAVATTTDKIAFTAGTGVNGWAIKDTGNGALEFASTSPSTGATTTPSALTLNPTGNGWGFGTTTLNNTAFAVTYPAGIGLGDIFSVQNATATPFRVSANSKIFMPNLTTSAGTQTSVLCGGALGEVIADSVACIASDPRAKENIKPLTGALDEILKLKPVSFNYTAKFNGALQSNPNFSGEQVGFSAKDVQKIDPRLVEVYTQDSTTGTFPVKAGEAQTVRYQNLVSPIIGAIQDFYKQFQILVARVSGLEGKVNAQQKEIDALNVRLDKLEK